MRLPCVAVNFSSRRPVRTFIGDRLLPFKLRQRPTFVIMVALRNRTDHYIFALWFLSSFFLLLFPRLI